MSKVYVLDTRPLYDDELFNQNYQRLSNFRKKKVDDQAFRKDKNLSLGAGMLINKVLSEYGIQEKDVSYSLGLYGKPSINELKDFHFSISHSGYYAVLAFSSNPIGCDIEEIKPIEDGVKELCLSCDELKEVSDEKGFYKLWCMKESYLKAKGDGLEKDPRIISKQTVLKEYQISEFDNLENYYLVICHKDRNCSIAFL